MNGKTIVRVTSYLMLVLGILATISGAYYVYNSIQVPVADFKIDKTVFVAILAAKLLASAGEVAMGGIAIKNLENESKRNLLILLGIVISVIFAGCHIFSGIVAHDFTTRALLIDLFLPVLFVIGMIVTKKEDAKGLLDYAKGTAIKVEVDED
jgi:heme/copper-type cytochrome/quinol oxidase subunit 3